MSDAFRNYSNLLNSLAAEQNQADNKATQYHQTKASADGNVKILGETKLFLSGKSGLEKASKNIVKPLWSKYGSSIKNSLREKFGLGENKPPIKAPSANEGYDSWDQPFEGSEDRVADVATRSQGEQDEAFDLLDKGASRLKSFNSKVASGETEGEELTQNVKDLKNPFMDTIDDWKGTNATNFTQAKTSFTDSDIGNEGSSEYNTTNGLSEEESSRLSEINQNAFTPNQTTGDILDQSRGGALKTPVAEANEMNSEPKSLPKGLGKTGAEEDAVEDGVEEGVEEGSLGILDAVPGLDILGAIGGAVLAGIEGHKQKKETDAELDAPNLRVNVNTQVGIAAQEALG